MGTLAGTLSETAIAHPVRDKAEPVGIAEGGMELARGIEPPTCGLQKPSEAISSDRESPDKIDEPIDGSGE